MFDHMSFTYRTCLHGSLECVAPPPPSPRMSMWRSVIIRTFLSNGDTKVIILLCSCCGLFVKRSIFGALFSKRCIFTGGVFPIAQHLSSCPWRLRLQRHYGRWLRQKRDETVFHCDVELLSPFEMQDLPWCTVPCFPSGGFFQFLQCPY